MRCAGLCVAAITVNHDEFVPRETIRGAKLIGIAAEAKKDLIISPLPLRTLAKIYPSGDGKRLYFAARS